MAQKRKGNHTAASHAKKIYKSVSTVPDQSTASAMSSRRASREEGVEDAGEALEPEDSEDKLKHLCEEWTAPVYAFFKPEVKIEYCEGHCTHVFKCANRGCKTSVRRYLDKGDAKSTRNLCKYARKCWGDEALAAVDGMKEAGSAHVAVEKYMRSGSITASFMCKGKGKITFSMWQHTRTET
ncbi:hypothetical protein BKA93DRAFT_749321 [Sparassis latifolia]